MEHKNPLIVETILSQKQKNIPIWLMRQAGRSLPEYRKAVEGIANFIKMCYQTDLIVELTLQPIRRFDFDAAIIFSDILIILDILGCDVEFIRGVGPKIKPIKTIKDLGNFKELSYKALPILTAIKNVRTQLPHTKALIGFAGGPWTVASYLLGSSSTIASSPLLTDLIDTLTEMTIQYLIAQIHAGVDIVQLFDSHAGLLTPPQFLSYVVEPTTKIVSALRSTFCNIPIIGFPRSSGMLYKDYCAKTGISAISIDYNVSIEWAKTHLHIPIQGNLSPSLLAYNKYEALEQAKRIIDCFRDLPFIFNLGHGVLPETPIENIHALVNLVRTY